MASVQPTPTMTLLPPPKDACQTCAVKHPAEAPHNQQSLYYQYWFYGKHGRWPTWADAMEHCTPEVQQLWINALAKRGVIVELPQKATA